MKRTYGVIQTGFWLSPDIQKLTDQAMLLAAYCLTGPQSNIAGVFRAPDGYVSEDLGSKRWPIDRVSEGFTELYREGFATRDHGTGWVVIHKYLKWNPVSGPKQRAGVLKVVLGMPPGTAIAGEVLTTILQYCQGLTEPQREKLTAHLVVPADTLSLPFPNLTLTPPIAGTGSGTGSGRKPGEGVSPPRAAEAEKPAVLVAKAYSQAMVERYGVQPAMNSKMRGQFAKVVERIPEGDAPEVASFYVRHTHARAIYGNSKHCVDLLVRDVESLHLEWQQATTGKRGIGTGNWWESTRGIEAKGRELEVNVADAGSYGMLKAMVFLAAGEGPWMEKLDSTTSAYLSDLRAKAAA